MANASGIPGAGDNLVQLITILGGGTVIGAVINGFFSRRKTGADATKVLQEAASNLVHDMATRQAEQDEELRELRAEVKALRVSDRTKDDEIADLQSWKSAQERLNLAHGQWDSTVVRHLGEAGIDLPPPPPLATDHQKRPRRP